MAVLVVMSGLEIAGREGVRYLTDRRLLDESGILVAFSFRSGGASRAPYASLNLAAHVGDEPSAVDANRERFLGALGLAGARGRLTVAEQVHGLEVREVTVAEAGAGASAEAGRAAVPATDGLLTAAPDVPLMMLFADCVPVVLVARRPVRAVAVAHAGWKGVLGGIAGKAASALAARAGCRGQDLLAYIGPHVCPEHYRVDEVRLSHFERAFGSIAAARGGLDLGAVVTKSLSEVGVPPANVVRADICTAERTEDLYSFRAEGTTGRHAALSVILEPSR